MATYGEWKIFQWHCPNCGNKVTGFKNEKGDIKAQCCRCKVCMVRVIKTPKHQTIEVFAPKAENY